MSATFARPAALEAFRDETLRADAALATQAERLRSTLRTYLRTNADGADHRWLADRLAEHARAGAALATSTGAFAAALRRADRATGAFAAAPWRADRATGAFAAAPWRADPVTVIDGVVPPLAAVDELGASWLAAAGDLRQLLVPLDAADWSVLVYGVPHCPTDLAGRYAGAGGIRGPDGRIYPLVVPELEIDGRIVHSSLRHEARRDPASLGGSDPGWWTLRADTGVTRVADPPSRGERVAAVGSVATGLGVDATGWASPSQLADVRFDRVGLPSLANAPAAAAAGPWPAVGVAEAPTELTVEVDGELHVVDPERLDEQPRRVRRAFIAQYGSGTYLPPSNRGLPSQRTVSRATNAADLVGGALEGVQVSRSMDDVNHAAYQVRFEVHPDGRRRAQLVLASMRERDGVWTLRPSFGHVGPDGALVRTPARYDLAETVGPTDVPDVRVETDRPPPAAGAPEPEPRR